MKESALRYMLIKLLDFQDKEKYLLVIQAKIFQFTYMGGKILLAEEFLPATFYATAKYHGEKIWVKDFSYSAKHHKYEHHNYEHTKTQKLLFLPKESPR